MTLLQTHKKFFDKAKNNEYIQKNFLDGVRPLHIRQGQALIPQAQEYKDKLNKKSAPKKADQKI